MVGGALPPRGSLEKRDLPVSGAWWGYQADLLNTSCDRIRVREVFKKKKKRKEKKERWFAFLTTLKQYTLYFAYLITA